MSNVLKPRALSVIAQELREVAARLQLCELHSADYLKAQTAAGALIVEANQGGGFANDALAVRAMDRATADLDVGSYLFGFLYDWYGPKFNKLTEIEAADPGGNGIPPAFLALCAYALADAIASRALPRVLSIVDEFKEKNRAMLDCANPRSRGDYLPRYDFASQPTDRKRTWGDELASGKAREHAEASHADRFQQALGVLHDLCEEVAPMRGAAFFASLCSRVDRLLRAKVWQEVDTSKDEGFELARNAGRQGEFVSLLLCRRPIDPRLIDELRADVLAALGAPVTAKLATEADVPSDLAATKVIVERYEISLRTVRTQCKRGGKLTRYTRGGRVYLSESEVAKHYTRRDVPQKRG